jgi:uncharacterized protein (DUF2062 family)
MPGEPRICVVVPVYNHGLTAGEVAARSSEYFPVIAVNDGSTDGTQKALEQVPGIRLVVFQQNQGKAAALRAGFAKALELGYTHAITIDADGQHPVEALQRFAALCRERPDAFIIGVRDLKLAAAPWPRRFSNALSTFWFKFETGATLTDTQCGYRVYPLRELTGLQVRADRYAYELEIMAKAAWAGIPLVPCPVQADYAAPTSRMSHFHPWRDFLRISRLHSRLSMQAFCVPAPLRQLAARGVLQQMPRRHKIRFVLGQLFREHTQTPGRLSGAVGLGLFCGIAPIWGAQMLVAALLAHKLKVNKAVALTASNISFPLAAPFIMAASLVLGHFLWTGTWMDFDARVAARQVPLYIWEWALGSVVLALAAAVLGGLLTFLVARLTWSGKGPS